MPVTDRRTSPRRNKDSRKQANPKKNLKAPPPSLREIKRLQNSTDNLIPRLPFARLVREILMSFNCDGYRIQRLALEALQEASEMYLTLLMEDAYRCTLHRQRLTLMPIDIQLVRLIRGMGDMGVH